MKKKIIPLLTLSTLLVPSLTGCKQSPVDVAMISDIGTINDSGFNQYTWEGAKTAADSLNMSSAYYVPTKDTDDERKAGIDAMIKRGAKVIVLTGYKFNSLADDYAKRYPNIGWFLIDGSQSVAANLSNVYSVEFREQEAGYLAGYAVVKDKKYTNLAFLGGMAVPAVERFGFGYLSGICDAVNELAEAGQLTTDINVTYGYTGDFGPSEKNQSSAFSWYNEGTDVIFTCGGAICDSVVAASKKTSNSNAKMIGVDVNQHPQQTNDLYITSAEKKVEKTTNEAIKKWFSNKDAEGNGNWGESAGKHDILGSTTNSIGLPTDVLNGDDPWTFTNFTKDDYSVVYKKLQDDYDFTKVVSTNDNDTVIKDGFTLDNTHVKISYRNVGQEVSNKPAVKVAENAN